MTKPRRIVWAPMGEIKIPDLPPEFKNWIKVNPEWMERYAELHKYRSIRYWPR